MKTVIITGSTRGIGFGLADHFLRRGCAVVVSGRTQPGVDQAVSTLLVKHDTRQVFGVPCEVTEFAQVQALWEAAKAHFGQVDIWVNNAGVSRPQRNVWENPPEDLQAVITTNVLGTLYGSKVAITSMSQITDKKTGSFGYLFKFLNKLSQLIPWYSYILCYDRMSSTKNCCKTSTPHFPIECRLSSILGYLYLPGPTLFQDVNYLL